jgi:hypothetical protein
MLSNNIDICKSYDGIRRASRLGDDISTRPTYQHLYTTSGRYSGTTTAANSDRTFSGGNTTTSNYNTTTNNNDYIIGDLAIMFFMKPIEKLSEYILKHI